MTLTAHTANSKSRARSPEPRRARSAEPLSRHITVTPALDFSTAKTDHHDTLSAPRHKGRGETQRSIARALCERALITEKARPRSAEPVVTAIVTTPAPTTAETTYPVTLAEREVARQIIKRALGQS